MTQTKPGICRAFCTGKKAKEAKEKTAAKPGTRDPKALAARLENRIEKEDGRKFAFVAKNYRSANELVIKSCSNTNHRDLILNSIGHIVKLKDRFA